jgi:hypothetical protein
MTPIDFIKANDSSDPHNLSNNTSNNRIITCSQIFKDKSERNSGDHSDDRNTANENDKESKLRINLKKQEKAGNSKPQLKVSQAASKVNANRKSSSDSYKNENIVSKSNGTNLIINPSARSQNKAKTSSSNDSKPKSAMSKSLSGTETYPHAVTTATSKKAFRTRSSTSSNENADNGYFTMTHNTSHHLLTDQSEGVISYSKRMASTETNEPKNGIKPKIIVLDKSDTSSLSIDEIENDQSDKEADANAQIYKATAQLGKHSII